MLPPRYAAVVALYGDDKPGQLRSLISGLQAEIGNTMGEYFLPRPLHDIHSTIIGLESGGPVGQDQVSVAGIDVKGLCRDLDESFTKSPWVIRFGGFANRDYGISSRGLSLYVRALTIGAGKVVLIGWPIDHFGEPNSKIDGLRRDLGQFGAKHRYHPTPEAYDPDSYMVIGDLAAGGDATKLDACVKACRYMLSQGSCDVRLGNGDVGLVTYVNTKLPAASTTIIPISDVGRRFE